MPIYKFKEKENGEITEVSLRISELDQYKEDNPNLQQVIDYTPNMVTNVKSPLTMAGSGWKDHLKNIKSKSGRGNTIKV